MSNPIKYSTGTESLALKKGNFYIGTGDVGKGPSDTTGYYQGPNVPSGGYVIYMNNSGAPGDLSYHVAANDSELISFTNNLAGQSYTTVNECLVYFAGQSDKVCLNRDYEGIATDGLVLNLDAGFTPSYPRSGTTWYDVGGTNNGTLINGPTFSGGSIVFDGVDDYVQSGIIEPQTLTLCAWFKPTGPPSNDDIAGGTIICNTPQLTGNAIQYAIAYSWLLQRVLFSVQSNNEFLATSSNSVLRNQIHYMVGTFDGTNRKIYINGVNVASDVRAVSPIYPTSGNRNVQVGRWGYPNYSRIINGNLYSASIYNRALSASEVLQNYNAQKGRFGL